LSFIVKREAFMNRVPTTLDEIERTVRMKGLLQGLSAE